MRADVYRVVTIEGGITTRRLWWSFVLLADARSDSRILLSKHTEERRISARHKWRKVTDYFRSSCDPPHAAPVVPVDVVRDAREQFAAMVMELPLGPPASYSSVVP